MVKNINHNPINMEKKYTKDQIKDAIWQELKGSGYTGDNNDRAYEVIGIVMAGIEKILVEEPRPGPVWVKDALTWAKEALNFAADHINIPESLTEHWGNMYLNSLHAIDQALDESGAAAPDWAKLYDTLYYTVLPVLHKLRHRTDNNTRMVNRGSEIRDTIINTIAEIKKLPDPIYANEPPFLVQSESTPAAGREESDAVEFHDWVEANRWTLDNTAEYTHNTEQLYQLFKEQKEK